MAGRTPREALAAFIDPLQRALSCVTRANIVYRPPRPGHVQVLGVSEEPIRLQATAGRRAPALYVEQQYEVGKKISGQEVQAGDLLFFSQRGDVVDHVAIYAGNDRILHSTRAYRYRIDSAARAELVLWHWHPTDREERSHREPRPHLHAQVGELRGLHLLTGRVGLESVIRVLLNELGVRPRRDDWQDVLDATEECSSNGALGHRARGRGSSFFKERFGLDPAPGTCLQLTPETLEVRVPGAAGARPGAASGPRECARPSADSRRTRVRPGASRVEIRPALAPRPLSPSGRPKVAASAAVGASPGGLPDLCPEHAVLLLDVLDPVVDGQVAHPSLLEPGPPGRRPSLVST